MIPAVKHFVLSPLHDRIPVARDALITTDVSLAADLIRQGRLVAFATETVYGLGANAFDEQAVARVFDVKNRPRFDPLIVHVAAWDRVDQVARHLPEAAQRLAREFWPGPLTLVLPKRHSVPDLVTAGLPSVAVRMPSHPTALQLLEAADCPIAAPSANPFGKLSPTTAEHVAATLGNAIDLILDGGPSTIGVESTVVGFDDDGPCILRHGGLPQEELEAVVGPVTSRENTAGGPAESPGQLPQHYAPGTPLQLIEPEDLIAEQARRTATANERLGLLQLQPEPIVTGFDVVEVLTPDGNLRDAAAGFFAALRRLDSSGVDRILALPFPDQGLGRALNDRLRRACH